MSIYFLKGTPQEITLQVDSVATPATFKNSHIVIRPTVDIYISIGPDPTASANGNLCHFVGEGELFPIQVNYSDKLAAIPATSSGVGGKVRISPIGIN